MLDAAAFQTQLLAASATKEASTGHCQRFIGKLSNSLSRSHTIWLSRSSSLAATRSLSFRRRIRSDLTFPGEIRGPRRLQSVQKRNQLTRPSRLTAFSASTGCLAVFDSRMLCHSFPQGPNARSLRTSSDCAAADASTWTWQLARACTWAHIIFCSRCAALRPILPALCSLLELAYFAEISAGRLGASLAKTTQVLDGKWGPSYPAIMCLFPVDVLSLEDQSKWAASSRSTVFLNLVILLKNCVQLCHRSEASNVGQKYVLSDGIFVLSIVPRRLSTERGRAKYHIPPHSQFWTCMHGHHAVPPAF